MRKLLTGKQRTVFNFVRQKIDNGFPPSIREIADHCGFSYKSAYDLLKALVKKGYIRIEPGKVRSIFLLPPYKDDPRHAHLVETDVPDIDIRNGNGKNHSYPVYGTDEETYGTRRLHRKTNQNRAL